MKNAKSDDKESDDNQAEKSFTERLKYDLKSARFWLEVLALIGLYLYVCQTRRTNNLTETQVELNRKALRMTYGTKILVSAVLYQLKPLAKTSVNIQFRTDTAINAEGKVIDRVARNVIVSTNVGFFVTPPSGGLNDAAVRNFEVTSPDRLDCLHPNQTTCTLRIVGKELSIEEYADYKGGKKLFVWGEGTYTDAASSVPEPYKFCRYNIFDETHPMVDAVVNGEWVRSKALGEDKWEDCQR